MCYNRVKKQARKISAKLITIYYIFYNKQKVIKSLIKKEVSPPEVFIPEK